MHPFARRAQGQGDDPPAVLLRGVGGAPLAAPEALSEVLDAQALVERLDAVKSGIFQRK